jgi:3-oxoacyl-[acyl-carrier protein] reductase
MNFEGQVALITGAGSGIGRATAVAFAKQGARVAVNYHRNRQGAEAVVKSISETGREAMPVRADVTSAADVAEMVRAVRDVWGRIDILVNNAGDLLGRQSLAEMTEDYWDQTMNLNLKSVFLCVKAVWEEMAERRSGSIVNVSSIAGRHGGGVGAGVYAAAKGGLIVYTKALAKELAPRGVRVNGVNPGVIDTPYHQRNSSRETYERMISSVPMGRAGTPEDVADVIVFLASDAARYVTGENIELNGGLLMD